MPRPTSRSSPRHCSSRRVPSAGAVPPSGRRRARADGSACRCRATLPPELIARPAGEPSRGSGGDARALEVLVRRAVLPLRQRRPLAGLPLARGRATARNAAVEGAGLDLLLDELDRGGDALVDRPGDLRLARIG